MDAPVVIVGAGPTGCAVALQLARQGVPSLLLEKHRDPPDKACGEGLMPHGVRELEMLGLGQVLTQIRAQPFDGIQYWAAGVMATGRFPTTKGACAGYGVRRVRLHRALHQACQARPAITVRRGVAASGLQCEQHHATVHTSQGPVRCQLVVGADGLHSTIRRLVGLKVRTQAAPRFGVRAHCQLSDNVDMPTFVQVYLANRLEYYVTPTGPGEVNVALLCEKDITRTFRGDLTGKVWERMLNYPPLQPLLAGATPLTPALLVGPLRQHARSSYHKRVALAGDAAGFIDGITGEGMSLSLVSARLLAEHVGPSLAQGRLDPKALAAYHVARKRAWKQFTQLTRLVLWGVRHPRIATYIVRNLARRPAGFDRVLAVGTGAVPLSRFGLRHALEVLAGV